MSVEQQIAILYCGTNGLLKDVPLSKVLEFEKVFLNSINLSHKEDVLKPLSQGIMNDEIGQIIEKVALEVSKYLID